MFIPIALPPVHDITYETPITCEIPSVSLVQRIPDEMALTAFYLDKYFRSTSTDVRTVKPQAIDRSSIIMQLIQIASLDEGWDGYGAEKVCENCIDNARSVISALPQSIPSPDLFPNTNGTITLEWDTGVGTLSIELGDDSFSAFIDTNTTQRFEQGVFDAGIPPFVSMAFSAIFPQREISEQPGFELTVGGNDSIRYITNSHL